jgi:UDP-N-acetylmuramate--alanine ligase
MAGMSKRKAALPWRHVHFVGVGGVGMAGLAHIVADFGVTVSGTDAVDSAMLGTLLARGLDVSFPHAQSVPDGADLVVYSNAVPARNPERQDADAKGIPSCLRGEFLARLAVHFPTVVSIAGSHGKTTTSAMLAHILRATKRAPGFLVGAAIPGWPRAAGAGDGEILVTEVDESDGTQALMRSTYAVVVNVEDDHCWSVGGIEALEECFRTFASRADHVLSWDGPATRRLFADHASAAFLGGEALPMSLSMPGRHNRIDAALALAVAVRLGVPRDAAVAAMRTFPGVDRRLSVRYESPDGRTVLVEDYAHHPTELHAAMQALREGYRDHELHVVFQPHRFERVLRFGSQFSEELSQADRVVVYRPFAAWREDGDLADPAGIARGIDRIPARYAEEPITELAASVVESIAAPTVVVVIGAGDIHDLIAPLRERLAARDVETSLSKAVDLPCPVSRRASWAGLTTLGVGTARPILCEPRSAEELTAVLAFACRESLPIFPLGNGSNLLGTDQESACLAIRLGGDLAGWTAEGSTVRVGAGLALGRMARELAARGRCPEALSALAWIPASFGGAARMNAGAEGFDMASLVTQVRGVSPQTGRTVIRSADQIDWQYRATDLGDLFITDVWFALPEEGDAQEQEARLAEYGSRRRERQPAGRSAGCVFRNPVGDSAGRLIDACRGKGMAVGGARVSQEHANIFVAEPGTTETDFLELVRRVRQRVHDQTGIELELEVQVLGTFQP